MVLVAVKRLFPIASNAYCMYIDSTIASGFQLFSAFSQAVLPDFISLDQRSPDYGSTASESGLQDKRAPRETQVCLKVPFSN